MDRPPRDWRAHSRILLIVAAIALAWILYPKPTRQSHGAGVTEITYWTRPGTYSDLVRPAIEEFERQHPEYHVILGTSTSRNATGDPTRFLLGVAGDAPPDLILFDRFAIVEWASRGAFTDLGPYIARDADKADAIREENFFPPTWKEAIYKGANFAVAADADTRALYYNCDSLIRGGFTYSQDDAEVAAGRAKAGDARPPRTWEEVLRRRVDSEGIAREDGVVNLTKFVRRTAVNEDISPDAQIDLQSAGVRVGDVAALISGSEVFRARVGEIVSASEFRLEFTRELAPGIRSVPTALRGNVEVKVFDQDGYVNRLTRFDPATGDIVQAGFVPFYGNSWLYMYAFLNNAQFVSDDGATARLNSHEIVEALQWATDIHDAMGGAPRVEAFRKGAESGGVQRGVESGATQPFIAGKIPMVIDTDGLMQTIMAFKPNLAFGVSGGFAPEKLLATGFNPVGWGGGWAYAIPATAKKKDAAWELLRWLASPDANKIVAEADASYRRAMGQTLMPPLQADRRTIAWLKETYVDNNPAMGPYLRRAYGDFVTLLQQARYRPVTPVGQVLWAEHVRAAEKAVNHTAQPAEALEYGQRRVQQALDDVLHPRPGPVVNWSVLIALYVATVALLIASLIIAQVRSTRVTRRRRREWFEGYVCAAPWIIGFLVFGAGPIFFSIIISFCHYDVLSPARFIGIGNYAELLGTHVDAATNTVVWNDAMFWRSLANTGFMIITVPLGIALGLGIALLLDTRVRGMNFYRTIFYLPAIVPAVAGFMLWFFLLDPAHGYVNQALRVIGIRNPPNWFLDPLWSKPALVLMILWGVGGSMIIWLAGLKDIPESYYEAAEVDGANAWQRFWRITLPLLTPYILFNAIIGMIGVFQIFEAAFVMTDGGPADSTMFFAYKLFNEAFRFLNMGIASAMAWILFLVVLAITLLQLWLSRKWVHYGA
ncbi:hypothetical protein BH09SUM1_BH09SUM1_33330 [soil metagenome]